MTRRRYLTGTFMLNWLHATDNDRPTNSNVRLHTCTIYPLFSSNEATEDNIAVLVHGIHSYSPSPPPSPTRHSLTPFSSLCVMQLLIRMTELCVLS